MGHQMRGDRTGHLDVVVISSDCSLVANQFLSQIPTENTLRDCFHLPAVYCSALPANLAHGLAVRAGDFQRAVFDRVGLYAEGAFASVSVGRTVVMTNLVEDLTGGLGAAQCDKRRWTQLQASGVKQIL